MSSWWVRVPALLAAGGVIVFALAVWVGRRLRDIDAELEAQQEWDAMKEQR